MISSSGPSALRFGPVTNSSERQAARAAHGRALDLAPSTGAAAARRRPATPCRDCRRSCRDCGSAASRRCATPPRARAAARRARAHRLGVGEAGAEPERAVLARPAAQLRDLVQVEHRLRARAVEVERDHQVGAALDRQRVGMLGPQAQRLVERSRASGRPSGRTVRFRRSGLHPFRAASPSRAATSPPTSSSAAAACSRVFTREWLEADVAIVDGFVAGLGDYEGARRIDATGRCVVPGFIDAHMHLESSKLLPDEFARLVLPLGTTAVVADPHEIANVLGTDGVHWLLDATAGLPLDVYFMASSCVPASSFESPRRELTPGDLDALLRRRRVLGLAEMMNFPGVIAGDASELAKLALADARRRPRAGRRSAAT